MLNNIINSEPVIKVGIILPEDRKNYININIPSDVKFDLNGQNVSGELNIYIENDQLIFNNKHFDFIQITSIQTDSFLTVSAVPTGRGFHWQKTFNTKLSGNIIIKNIDGNIFLINEVPTEKYLPYVATAEMNPDCPIALLEAQTIAARSWLLANRNANHPNLDIDVCNDDCCQRYQGIIEVPLNSMESIKNTYGHVLTYKNEICDARYSKSCGGVSESFENAWGGKSIDYLSSIADNKDKKCEYDLRSENEFNKYLKSDFTAFCSPQYVTNNDLEKYLGIVDTSDSYYRWQIEYIQEELTSILNHKLNLDIKSISDLIVQKRGFSGRIIKLKIVYIDKSDAKKSIALNSEYDIRNALHKKFLYSSAINIETIRDSNQHISKIKLKGAGWGHGAGLCQIGALGMALDGYSSEQILKHYFKDSQIEKIY